MVHLFRFTAEKATVDLGKVPYHFKEETSIAFKMTNTEAFPGAAAGFGSGMVSAVVWVCCLARELLHVVLGMGEGGLQI